MTRKMKDLRDFMQYLSRLGYTKKIGDISLRQAIAEKFGISEYVEISMLKQLVRFGFIRPEQDGTWTLNFSRKYELGAFYEEVMEVKK